MTDDITVAGLKLAKHTFGTASLESVQFSSDSTDFDGLMGLAQSVSHLSSVSNHLDMQLTSGFT